MEQLKVKNFRVIFVADPHMSNKLPYSKPTQDGLTDRFEHQLSFWDSVRSEAEKSKVDAVIILGDLFDKAVVDAVTLTYTIDAIVKIPCDVFILPGNHDANIANGRFLVEAFGKMGNEHVKVIGDKDYSTIQVDLDGEILEFWPMAFKSVERTEKELREINSKISLQIKTPNHNYLLLHNEIKGAKNNGGEARGGLSSRLVCQDFERVYAGHYHKMQNFGPLGNGLYVGSPMHHDFEDVGNAPGFLLTNFEKGEGKEVIVVDTHIEIDLPKFYIHKSLDEPITAKPGDYVRFELNATKVKWPKILSRAKAVCDKLMTDSQVNAFAVHVVEPHHKSRIKSDDADDGKPIKFENAIADYVDSEDVETNGLNHGKLKKIGLRFLNMAKELE